GRLGRGDRRAGPRRRLGRRSRGRPIKDRRLMVTLKSPREIDTMARAGAVVHATLELCRGLVEPGITTEDLDREAEKFIRSHRGATPSFKGLYGFPKSLCISITEEVVH